MLRLVRKIMTDAAIHGSLTRLMAGYATIHADIRFPPETVSFRNRAVASLARCATFQVYFVTEIDESRNFVNADPGNGSVRLYVRSQAPDGGAVGLHCLMTSHAHLGLRNPFYVAGFHRFMAVIAFEACHRRVLFVAERNRLYRGARFIMRKHHHAGKRQDKLPGSQIAPVRICSAR